MELRFNLDSGDFRSLPVQLQERCSEMDICSVTFGLDADTLWVVHCKRFSVLNLSELGRFELWYWTPAKGRGSISIGAERQNGQQGSEMLGLFHDYSDGKLALGKSYLKELQSVLGYLPEVVCYGADC